MALFTRGGVVGLDIGASAVRLARVAGSRDNPSLVSFAQSALPPGAVVDGEVRDGGALSQALADLWKRAKPGANNVVIGVANQRVVVRQVDLPYLEEKEFRSAMRFQAADYIPMPIESAQLDAIILEDYATDTQEHMMRVLLVAAATDMVEAFVSAASAAKLDPIGIDLLPFAVARAVSPAARGEQGVAGSEAIIDVGAGITNILIHANGGPRFVRILQIGGDDATAALAEASGVSPEEAEAMKLDLGQGVGNDQARRVLDAQVDRLVDEIRGSLDYYLSQEDSEPVSSVILTGGGSLMAGLQEKLESTLRTSISRGAPLSQMNTARAGLTPEQVQQVEPVAAAAVGLALGAMER